MNSYQKSVKTVEDIINATRDEPLEIDISVMIQDNNGVSNIYPGIQLIIPGVEMPIFIAAGELKILSEASEKYCAEKIEKQTKSTKKKKT